MNTKEFLKFFVKIAAIVFFVLFIWYLVWYAGKFVNYKFSYEGMVQNTCRAEIKREVAKWHKEYNQLPK